MIKCKGIKANLILPKECDKIFENMSEENFKKYMEIIPEHDVDIGLGEYDGKLCCYISVCLLAKTKREVNNNYKLFKEIIKSITNKKPYQVYRMDYTQLF